MICLYSRTFLRSLIYRFNTTCTWPLRVIYFCLNQFLILFKVAFGLIVVFKKAPLHFLLLSLTVKECFLALLLSFWCIGWFIDYFRCIFSRSWWSCYVNGGRNLITWALNHLISAFFLLGRNFSSEAALPFCFNCLWTILLLFLLHRCCPSWAERPPVWMLINWLSMIRWIFWRFRPGGIFRSRFCSSLTIPLMLSVLFKTC